MPRAIPLPVARDGASVACVGISAAAVADTVAQLEAEHRRRAQLTRLTMAPRRPAHRYSVYVVELADAVWNEHRFRAANPGYELGKPFVYVGMTGLDPDLRFDRHKAGIQANRYVRAYGLRLLPQLYAVYNPMPYDGARDMEVELAIGLREAGYGVWQA